MNALPPGVACVACVASKQSVRLPPPAAAPLPLVWWLVQFDGDGRPKGPLLRERRDANADADGGSGAEDDGEGDDEVRRQQGHGQRVLFQPVIGSAELALVERLRGAGADAWHGMVNNGALSLHVCAFCVCSRVTCEF